MVGLFHYRALTFRSKEMKKKLLGFICFLAMSMPLHLACEGGVKKDADEGFAKKNAEVGKWTQDLEAAKKLASEKNLPIFLNFTGSDWCGWCIHMDKKVFNTDAWKDYAKENLILVALDFPRKESLVPAKYVDRNRELASKFRVRGFPTYFLVSSDLTETYGVLGAKREIAPKGFIDDVRGLLSPN